jgi:hypothetical protein
LLEALERQEQDESARELSFLDRLALLVDQQWTWRQNQALARRVRASRLKGAACPVSASTRRLKFTVAPRQVARNRESAAKLPEVSMSESAPGSKN